MLVLRRKSLRSYSSQETKALPGNLVGQIQSLEKGV